MSNPYYDFETCAVYCKDCAPSSAECEPNEQSVDYPLHCSVCHAPLNCSMTTDGENYIIEQVRDELRKGAKRYLTIHDCYKGTWYERSPHYWIVADWVKQHMTWSNHERAQFCERAIAWMSFQARKRGIENARGCVIAQGSLADEI